MHRSLMNRTWPIVTTTLLVLALSIPWARVVADVTIQQETTIRAPAIKAHGTTTNRIAGDKQRNETQFSCDGVMSMFCGRDKTVHIVRLDRRVEWEIEPKQRHYTEFPLPTPEQRRAQLAHQRAVIDKLKSCPPPRTTIDTSKCDMSSPVFAVNKTADQSIIIGHQVQRTNVSMTQSCRVKESTDVCNMIYSFDVWLTQEQLPGLGDRATFASAYQRIIGGNGEAHVETVQMNPTLAPYADSLKELSERSSDFKGYPLKTTFRVAMGGAHCALIPGPGSPQSGGDNTLANAGTAAGEAGAYSTQNAAGWGASEAVQKASGSSLGGYVAGSTAGAFTRNLVGGLFGKRKKADPAAPSSANPQSSATEAATTVAEITVETTAIDPSPVAADQFEVPSGWKKLDPKPFGSEALPNCPTT